MTNPLSALRSLCSGCIWGAVAAYQALGSAPLPTHCPIRMHRVALVGRKRGYSEGKAFSTNSPEVKPRLGGHVMWHSPWLAQGTRSTPLLSTQAPNPAKDLNLHLSSGYHGVCDKSQRHLPRDGG